MVEVTHSGSSYAIRLNSWKRYFHGGKEREKKRERHYKNAKNENEKPSIKKKKKKESKRKKERKDDVKYEIVYISGTADERMVTWCMIKQERRIIIPGGK